MNRKLTDISMIFMIGISPLCFQYIKQNVASTGIIDRIQSDIDKLSQKQPNPYLKRKFNVKDLIESKQQTSINPKIDLRIQTLKQWKSTSVQKYINQVSIVTGLHMLGGLLFPNPFFISIIGYFVLYQVNFMNEFNILNGKGAMFQKSKFNFEKVNQLYMYVGGAGLAIAGINKGISRFTKKATNDMFK